MACVCIHILLNVYLYMHIIMQKNTYLKQFLVFCHCLEKRHYEISSYSLYKFILMYLIRMLIRMICT